MSFKQRMTSGVLASSLGFAVSLVTALAQVPLLLSTWGAERMGVWLALQTVQVLASGLDVAHHAYVGNQLNMDYARDRRAALDGLGSALRVGVLTGLLPMLVLAVVMLAAGDYRGLLGIDPAHASLEECTWVLFLGLGTWAFTLSPGGLATKLYVARGDFARFMLCGVLLRILSLASMAAAVLSGAGLLGTAVAQALTVLVFHVWQFRDLRCRYVEDFPWWRHGALVEGLATYVRALSLTLNQLGQNLLGSGLLLIVSKELGSATLPAFQAMRTLVNLAQTANSMLVNPLTPELGRMLGSGDGAQGSVLLRRLQLASTWTLALAFPIMLFAAPIVFRWWTGGRLEISETALYLLYIATALRILGSGLSAAYASANALVPQLTSTWVNLATTLGVTLVLAPHLHLAGVAAGVTLGELAGSIVMAGRFRARVGLTSPVATELLRHAGLFLLLGVCNITLSGNAFSLSLIWLAALAVFAWMNKQATAEILNYFPRLRRIVGSSL